MLRLRLRRNCARIQATWAWSWRNAITTKSRMMKGRLYHLTTNQRPSHCLNHRTFIHHLMKSRLLQLTINRLLSQPTTTLPQSRLYGDHLVYMEWWRTGQFSFVLWMMELEKTSFRLVLGAAQSQHCNHCRSRPYCLEYSMIRNP